MPLPKILIMSDTILQETIEDPSFKGVIPRGANITNVRVIAGKYTSSIFRNAKADAEKYGGDPSEWQKKGGIVITENFRYDVHWEEYNGVQRKTKLKPPLQEVKK
ncbi:hypothetical protein FACS1894219_11190 [Clostridia bacterium]|nr:hypothetical protein FACS1894219_11190 [Clostridia bacterium]